ncbi:MAG: choice-of-anchor D domain-containing protein [Deltaproteobacteria bacterium]|nr:choice-of-anchor D domain-containing protein [Deltaproteobacteria bacterium]
MSLTGAALLALSPMGVTACSCEGDGGIAAVRPAIRADPSPLSFGTVFLELPAARVLRIANDGPATLDVSSIAVKAGSPRGLAVSSEPFSLAPHAERNVIVRLVPDALGSLSGALVISSSDPAQPELEVLVTAEVARRPGRAISVCVESDEIPLSRVCVDPLAIDFGAVAIGDSRRAAILVRSVGDAPLQILTAEGSGHAAFSFVPDRSPMTLRPDEEHVITAQVSPTSEGEIAATFQIISDDSERDLVSVVLRAEGVRAALCADPPAIDFGTTQVGQPVERSLRLIACGPEVVSIRDLTLVGSSELSLTASTAAVGPLLPGESRALTLRYEPVDRGIDRGDLRVSSDAGSLSVALLGRTAVCDLIATPPALAFGSMLPGQTRTGTVVLGNNGAADCLLSAINLTGSSEFGLARASTLPIAIAAGASVPLGVTYSPTDVGSDQGVLQVGSDDPLEPQLDVPLGGSGAGTGDCHLSVAPDPVAFGVVALGRSREIGVQIRNSGSEICTLHSAVMSAGSSTDFAITSGLGVPALSPGRQRSLRVRYTPTAIGPQQGRLEIHTGVFRSAPPRTVEVSGVASGSKLCPVPDPLVFGTHPQGTDTERTLSLIACGTEPVVISRLGFVSPTSPEYSFVLAPSLPLTVATGATATIAVRYRGADQGRDDGLLRISSNDAQDPELDVALVAASGVGCGDVQGTICGLDGLNPVAGADVYVDAPGGRVSAKTNAQGDFVLTCVPAGDWTVQVTSGSWSTSFGVSVSDGRTTTVAGPQCLDSSSARVAVVFGDYDRIEQVLDRIGVPYDFFDNVDQAALLLDAGRMAQYDIIFLNCGFDDSLVFSGVGRANLERFVLDGGAIYASDYAYDALEVAFPDFVDFFGDDARRNVAQLAPSHEGMVDVVDSSLRAGLGGLGQIEIDSCCVAIESAGPGTQTYLEGDRYEDGGRHPLFVGFTPGPSAGVVMFTDFHNREQPDIDALFRWLIARL